MLKLAFKNYFHDTTLFWSSILIIIIQSFTLLDFNNLIEKKSIAITHSPSLFFMEQCIFSLLISTLSRKLSKKQQQQRYSIYNQFLYFLPFDNRQKNKYYALSLFCKISVILIPLIVYSAEGIFLALFSENASLFLTIMFSFCLFLMSLQTFRVYSDISIYFKKVIAKKGLLFKFFYRLLQISIYIDVVVLLIFTVRQYDAIDAYPLKSAYSFDNVFFACLINFVIVCFLETLLVAYIYINKTFAEYSAK